MLYTRVHLHTIFSFLLFVILLTVWAKLGRVPVKAGWLVPEDDRGRAAACLLRPCRPVHEESV